MLCRREGTGWFTLAVMLALPVTAAPKPPLRNVTANLTDDDLIIQGNACIGESCTTSDDDFPVLKLKGLNPNILFDDVEPPPSLVSSSFNDWAIAVNLSDVAKFSILDVDGETTPFTILGGAPTNSLFVADSGNVGLGTASPSRKLHVITTSATDNVLVEVQNNGPARVRYTNATSGEIWNTGHQNPSGGGFIISDTGDAVAEMLLDTSGNVTFAGTVSAGSSRTIKSQFSAVDPHEMLRRVANLPITTWAYKDTPGVRHVGPMSEDFHAAFAVGADDKGISVTDSAGVAFAAIQGLYLELAERDAEIAALRARLEELAGRLEQRENAPK
ncbi:MAG: tail fiber domain-containing protein [Thermoanaerobaculia bacterium]